VTAGRLGSHPRVRRGVLAAAAAAIAATAISSCSSSPTTSPTTPPNTPSATTTSPTSSSTPTPTPSQKALAAAKAQIRPYLAMLDRQYNNPTTPLNDLYQVTTDPEFTIDAQAIGRFRAAGYRGFGSQKLMSVTGTSVLLKGTGGSGPIAKYPTVKLTACVDVSGSSAKDATGKPIGDPHRPKYLIESLTLVNIKYPDANGWRVANAPNKEANSCAG
jgi:hypothetical protein